MTDDRHRESGPGWPPGRRQLRRAFWLAAGAVGVLAFAPPAGPPGPAGLDKLQHAAAFAVLAALAGGAWPQRPATLRWGLLLAYGLLIEAVQAFLPYRDFSLFDLAADGAGIFVYAAGARILARGG